MKTLQRRLMEDKRFSFTQSSSLASVLSCCDDLYRAITQLLEAGNQVPVELIAAKILTKTEVLRLHAKTLAKPKPPDFPHQEEFPF